uniref:Arrestin C-terminal-like domain-containing protein n=1 Tax=Tetraselmis chuii TaxID=63592 RepID=A0A7S1XCE7_9CHLO|mmetsp:Transcript_8531/g.15415  ORF Transcript_8531/g.15415 Transcript_8531/m.15415 type:complete len:763 (+) Transcript_8531:283-2571(+)
MGVSTVFRIELDRPNGVYYAGEVVKGKVVLHLRKEVKCRGLKVRLLGQARAHWHTGGGEHRTDYDGVKTFQDHRITLFGNFFSSDVIDEGGENPTFGIAMGEGTIYVPCDDMNAPRELIVRVMDYDWGKRDDLLGEMVLDARELVASHEPRTYDLTRNGKSNSGAHGNTPKVTLSGSVMPLSALLPSGSTGATGAVVAQYCLVLEVHSCANLRSADWVGHNDVYVQTYFPPEGSVMVPGKGLPKPEKRTIIPAGDHEFPFVMPLRTDAPGSAEIGVGDYSYIRYHLHANIDLAAWADPASRRAITVLPSRPMPAPASLLPAVCHRPAEELHSVACCGCRCGKLGAVAISLATERQAYAIGERIEISTATVANHSKKAVEVELVLVRYTILTTTGRAFRGATKGGITRVAVLARATVSVGQTKEECCGAVGEGPLMPPAAPSFFGALGRAWGGDPVTWTYALELQVRSEGGGMGAVASASVPVLISAAPPFPNSVPPTGSYPPVDVSAEIPWSIATKAISSGDEYLSTGPLLSGSEDALGQATLVATGVPVFVALPTEARYIEDQSQLTFQPFELQWPESLDEWPAPGGGSKDGGVSTVVGGGNGDKGGGFAELLESLRSTLDRRTAVGGWVVSNPKAASLLSPEQMGVVLSDTPLSLEQPSVARELGLGLSGRLTCAHVLAAVQACPFAKTNVALALAPMLADPHNREPLLQELFSFDRQRVEAAMPKASSPSSGAQQAHGPVPPLPGRPEALADHTTAYRT